MTQEAHAESCSSEQVGSTGALSGLRVLDLGRYIAGPYCGMMLGDLGADVLHIERPGKGEDARLVDPFQVGESYYHLSLNRNKRSVTLNLRSETGQEVLRKLAGEADVLIENFRAGTMEKMGCGWQELSELNPRLIMVRASGFGQDGPHAERVCTDTIAYAMSGLMDLTGFPDGPPVLWGTFAVDYVTGIYAAIGVLAALQHRLVSGRGQVVDVALLDSAISLLLTALIQYGLTGVSPTRLGNGDRYTAPANTFMSADGKMVHIVVTLEQQFRRFVAVIGREDLLTDPRCKTPEERAVHREELDEILREWVAQRTAEEVIAAMTDASILCAKVATVEDVFHDPQLRHRGQIVDVPHSILGSFPMQGITPKLTDSPGSIRRGPPLLGEHTDEALREWLGYDSARVAELRAAGAV